MSTVLDIEQTKQNLLQNKSAIRFIPPELQQNYTQLVANINFITFSEQEIRDIASNFHQLRVQFPQNSGQYSQLYMLNLAIILYRTAPNLSNPVKQLLYTTARWANHYTFNQDDPSLILLASMTQSYSNTIQFFEPGINPVTALQICQALGNQLYGQKLREQLIQKVVDNTPMADFQKRTERVKMRVELCRKNNIQLALDIMKDEFMKLGQEMQKLSRTPPLRIAGQLGDNCIYSYNWRCTKKTILQDLQISNSSMYSMLSDGRLFIFGGQTQINPSFLTTQNQQESVQPMNYLRFNCAAVQTQNRIYVFGGLYQQRLTSLSEYFSIEDRSWHAINSLPDPRQLCGAAVHHNFIYIGGGMTGDSDKELAIFRYDTLTNQYQETQMRLPANTHPNIKGTMMFVDNDKLYALQSLGQLVVYSLSNGQQTENFSLFKASMCWSSMVPWVMDGFVYVTKLDYIEGEFKQVFVRISYRGFESQVLSELN